MIRRSIPEKNIDKLWTSTTILPKEIIPVDSALQEHNSYDFFEDSTQ